MDVYLLQYAKKLNSTMQPNLSILTPNDCKLKAPCSVLAPVIELYSIDITVYENVIKANYAYIAEFERYYYIKNWTFNDNILIASLEVDPLATYKTQIQSSTQYVLRSSAMSNGAIVDAKYPILTSMPQTLVSTLNNPLQPSLTDYGVFVVGILNDQVTFGGLEYYVFSYLSFVIFRQNLFNLATQWGSDTSVVAGIKKAITDPFQYVASIMWLPYSVADFVTRGFATQTTGVSIGYDTISMTAYYITTDHLNVEFTNLVTPTIPKHPLAATRGSYLNCAPYSRYYLSFYPFCGLIEIDSAKLVGATYLDLVYTVDLRTGKGVLSICTSYSGTSYADWKPVTPIQVIEAQIGVNIPLTNVYTALPTSLGQMVMNAGIAAADKFGGFVEVGKKITANVADVINDAIPENLQRFIGGNNNNIGAEPFNMDDLAKIASSAAAMNSTAEIKGSQGTISLNSRMPLQLWGKFYYVADEDNSKFGRPLCQSVSLSNLTGFVQCAEPRITLPSYAFPAEVAEIENYLASGLYIE